MPYITGVFQELSLADQLFKLGVGNKKVIIALALAPARLPGSCGNGKIPVVELLTRRPITVLLPAPEGRISRIACL
jgi:hypothetical protein